MPNRSFGYGRGQLQLALLDTLRSNGGTMRSGDLAEAVHSSRPNVSAALSTMFWRGKVARNRHGHYHLPGVEDVEDDRA